MPPAPFDEHREIVHPEWIDENGHFNMGYYMVAFDRATDTWLNTLPGVVENGLFVAMTHLVVVGEDDGSSRLIEKD